MKTSALAATKDIKSHKNLNKKEKLIMDERKKLNDVLLRIFNEKNGHTQTENVIATGEPTETGINLSDILSKLISSAGRFVIRYSSDLFITWNSVLEYIRSKPTEDHVFVFAMRQNGVDSNSYFKINSYTEPSCYYREVFFLKITKIDKNGTITAELQNMSGIIYNNDIEDIHNSVD